jgi:intracellular sulfur oxidation DsrE/DsrF family protein
MFLKLTTAAVLFFVGTVAFAAEPLNDDKPFAESHVILQLSQPGAARQSLVLDISNNLAKHYGGHDMVDIEVIAFAQGVPLLFAKDNANQARIESLMAQGVRFYVCGNTLDTIERKDQKRPEILPGVVVVQSGVAFILEENTRGYTIIQP